jgi:hypothetical protein
MEHTKDFWTGTLAQAHGQEKSKQGDVVLNK